MYLYILIHLAAFTSFLYSSQKSFNKCKDTVVRREENYS